MTLTRKRTLRPCWLASLSLPLLLLATQAQAQTPAPPPPPPRQDPLDPKVQVPALRYESAFAQFRRAGDNPPLSWREANDAVARIGGWRVYAREAQQPDPAPTVTPATPAPVPAPATAPGQSGHKH